MASKKLPRGTPEFEMFGEFYNLFQEFYETEDTDEWWTALIQEEEKFWKKYKNTIGRDLANALINYHERKAKEMREK